jgi:hypothetical protein
MSPQAKNLVEQKLKQFTAFLAEAQERRIPRAEAIKMMMKHGRGENAKA